MARVSKGADMSPTHNAQTKCGFSSEHWRPSSGETVKTEFLDLLLASQMMKTRFRERPCLSKKRTGAQKRKTDTHDNPQPASTCTTHAHTHICVRVHSPICMYLCARICKIEMAEKTIRNVAIEWINKMVQAEDRYSHMLTNVTPLEKKTKQIKDNGVYWSLEKFVGKRFKSPSKRAHCLMQTLTRESSISLIIFRKHSPCLWCWQYRINWFHLRSNRSLPPWLGKRRPEQIKKQTNTVMS